MEASKSFTDLKVWQAAHQFVLDVYRGAQAFPEVERFGLYSQFTRAAVSIPANIAEGYKRLGKAEKLRFFNISQGSLEECRYYILLAKDLTYISQEVYTYLSNEIECISRYLNSYCSSIREDKVTNGNFNS